MFASMRCVPGGIWAMNSLILFEILEQVVWVRSMRLWVHLVKNVKIRFIHIFLKNAKLWKIWKAVVFGILLISKFLMKFMQKKLGIYRVARSYGYPNKEKNFFHKKYILKGDIMRNAQNKGHINFCRAKVIGRFLEGEVKWGMPCGTPGYQFC